MRRPLPVFALCLILSGSHLSINIASAANIYIDQTLASSCVSGNYSTMNRDCSGTEGNGYTTIQAGADAMQSGDTIFMRGGTYYETHIKLTGSRHGSPEAKNRITSYPGEWATIDGQYRNPEYFRPAVLWCTGGMGMSNWIFDRFEITGGGHPVTPPAQGAGILIGDFCDHCEFRNLFVHDNYGDQNAPGYTGGIMISHPRHCVFENNVFKGNGNPVGDRNTGNAQLGYTSDYRYGLVVDPDASTHQNVIAYNLFDGQGEAGSSVIGFMQKGFQRLTGYNHGETANPEDAYPNDASYRDYGDQIHHNIFINVAAGIRVDQDYVQVYNNIIDVRPEGDFQSFAVETRDGNTSGRRGSYYASVYNNTVLAGGGIGIGFWMGTPSGSFYDCAARGPVCNFCYGFAANNLIADATHGYDWAYLSFEMSGNLNCTAPEPLALSHFQASRNLFHACTDGTTVIRLSNREYTPAEIATTDAADVVWQHNLPELFQGTDGAAKYKTKGNYALDDQYSIINGGLDGAHPYLAEVTIPTYVGATDPNNNAWVDCVMRLAEVDGQNIPVNLRDGATGCKNAAPIPPTAPAGLRAARSDG